MLELVKADIAEHRSFLMHPQSGTELQFTIVTCQTRDGWMKISYQGTHVIYRHNVSCEYGLMAIVCAPCVYACKDDGDC